MHDILRDTFRAGGSQTTQRMGACALRRATLLMSSSCSTSWPTVDSGSASRWTYVVAVDVAKRLPAQVAIDVVQHFVLRESHRYDNCSAGVVAIFTRSPMANRDLNIATLMPRLRFANEQRKP